MPGRGNQPPSGFGAALRRVRVAKNVTQAELGNLANVHPNTVAKLERGDQEPTWPLVLSLASALGVSCQEFADPPAADPPDGAAADPPRPAGKRK